MRNNRIAERWPTGCTWHEADATRAALNQVDAKLASTHVMQYLEANKDAIASIQCLVASDEALEAAEMDLENIKEKLDIEFQIASDKALAKGMADVHNFHRMCLVIFMCKAGCIVIKQMCSECFMIDVAHKITLHRGDPVHEKV